MNDISGLTVGITGASGFLGRAMVRACVARGAKVRTLGRRLSGALQSMQGVEQVLGDVLQLEHCERFVNGLDLLIHAAGFVSRDPKDASALYEVHVEGTRNILRVWPRAQAMVVISSSGTIAVSRSPKAISDEHAPYQISLVRDWPYYCSKIYQEKLVMDAAGQGYNIRVVLPSLLLGPGDTEGRSTEDVYRVVRGHVPVVPAQGGLAFVDVRDAAKGVVSALEQGQAGERYLLSGANMTLPSFAGRIARLAKRTQPQSVRIPPWACRGISRVLGVGSRLSDMCMDSTSFDMALHTWYADASKAERELGWRPRPFEQTLADTVMDIQQRRGM